MAAKTTETGGDEFVVPEDLQALNDEQLAELDETAGAHFDRLYGDGKDLTQEDLEALEALTEAIVRIQEETGRRAREAAERAEKAAELAERVRPAAQDTEPAPTDTTEDGEGEGDTDGDQPTETPEQEPETPETPTEPERREPGRIPEGHPDAQAEEVVEGEVAMVASTGRTTRIPMSRVRSRAARRPAPDRAPTIDRLQDILTAAADAGGIMAGQGIDWEQAAKIVDKHLAGFKPSTFEVAARNGQHLSRTLPVATITRPKPDDLIIHTGDPDEIERVLKRAVDESKTPQGSLVASGGWCAPSETYYDLTEMEGRDGLLSLPEVRVNRGGFKRTLGPDFSDLFALANGFVYTEAQDEAGTYGVDANGIGDGTVGDKPCVRVPCTDWEEFRLGVDGLCIVAGLLMQKGYPELIARTIRGILVAHDHIQSGRYIQRLVTGSDQVTMPAPTGGAIAPLLEAIELQAEHMRSIRRIPRGTTLEAKFPMWVHGMIRSDLAKRAGTDTLAVSDAQINAWFATKRINAQFLYNWQDIGGTAAEFTMWPQEVTFLLYPAGTWVKGGDDIINVSNLMDSALLGQNDYVALFTEESWLVAKMGFDSRVVTVPVCANGATSAPIEFPCPAPDAP